MLVVQACSSFQKQALRDYMLGKQAKTDSDDKLMRMTVGLVDSAKGLAAEAPGQPTHMVLKLLTPMRALTSPPALTYKHHSHVC